MALSSLSSSSYRWQRTQPPAALLRAPPSGRRQRRQWRWWAASPWGRQRTWTSRCSPPRLTGAAHPHGLPPPSLSLPSSRVRCAALGLWGWSASCRASVRLARWARWWRLSRASSNTPLIAAERCWSGPSLRTPAPLTQGGGWSGWWCGTLPLRCGQGQPRSSHVQPGECSVRWRRRSLRRRRGRGWRWTATLVSGRTPLLRPRAVRPRCQPRRTPRSQKRGKTRWCGQWWMQCAQPSRPRSDPQHRARRATTGLRWTR
mmetsp:Transcript_58633/g.138159  ORF Transcript_58633/g.138159 Transcript_58633/m.138159 type:complete len:259 (+) Transcript_58633:1111-1887(+)